VGRGQKKGFRHTIKTKTRIAEKLHGKAPLAIHIKRSCPTCGISMGAGNMGRHAPACAERSSAWPDKTVSELKVMRRRLKQYGLTPEDYARMWRSQGGVCAMCGGDVHLYVDHDHETLAVRGLLCGQCNRLLGCAADRPEILLRAVQYLSEHGITEGEGADSPTFRSFARKQERRRAAVDPWKD